MKTTIVSISAMICLFSAVAQAEISNDQAIRIAHQYASARDLDRQLGIWWTGKVTGSSGQSALLVTYAIDSQDHSCKLSVIIDKTDGRVLLEAEGTALDDHFNIIKVKYRTFPGIQCPQSEGNY